MADEFSEQIGKLHRHIEHVSHQVGEVKQGQDELHREHMQLRERVDQLERSVSKDIDNLAAHEREAELYRGHLIEGFERLSGNIEKLDSKFGEHARQEELDRKEVIRGQRTTIRSILLAALTFFSTGMVLLWQTGVLT
jgi:regulator of replication initiation timing